MTPTRKKPGRPEIGPNINVRMPRELVEWIDEQRATIVGPPSRAEFIRDVLDWMRGIQSTAEQGRADRELTQAQRQMLGEVRAHGGQAKFRVDRRRTAEGLAAKGLVTWENDAETEQESFTAPGDIPWTINHRMIVVREASNG